jgi:hypothetical protein
MEEIEFTHSIVRFKTPVVSVIFKEGAELDVHEVRELVVAAEKLSGNKPYVLFSDVRNHVTITSEARKVAADRKEASNLLANAVLTNSAAISMTVNFFIKFNKPQFPIKLFYDEAKAFEWMLKFAPEKVSM